MSLVTGAFANSVKYLQINDPSHVRVGTYSIGLLLLMMLSLSARYVNGDT